jgi:hypothetical protein
MSEHSTEYREIWVPASEVRGPYVSDSPWVDKDDYDGPEHTADVILTGYETWRKVEVVLRDKDTVTIKFDGGSGIERPAWLPLRILRPQHQPPFDPGVAGYYR